MNIKKKSYALILTLAVVFVSCDDYFDVNADPNNATSATPEQLLASSQLSMASIFGGQQTDGSNNFNEDPSIFAQHYYNLAESRFDIDGTDYDANWRDIYIEGLRDIENIIDDGTEQELWTHVGIAQVQKAFIYSVLVDLFGEVPYFQAARGEEFPNPVFDDGQDIYNDLFLLLDEAIVNLGQGATSPGTDLIYGGSTSNWIAAANTLKLKLYNQIRLVSGAEATAGINGLIADGNLISATSQDMEFLYGVSNTPLNQHPLFVENYTSGANQYPSAYLIFTMLNTDDPRLPFYVFRQSLADPTGDDIPCDDILDAPVEPYSSTLGDCYLGNGYYARPMGDDSGIPNDTQIRTNFGVYPVGGSFDIVVQDGTGTPISSRTVSLTSGAQGAGIQPFLTYFMSLFIQAEAALTLGTTGDPRTLLEQGMRAQITKVIDFGAANGGLGLGADIPDHVTGDPSGETFQQRMDSYVAAVLADYDAAADDAGRLEVIINEYHKATYGIGWEAYNAYRRTGFPQFYNMQAKDGSFVSYPATAQNAAHSPLGAFPRRIMYSQRELNTNPNSPSEAVSVSTPVFWDNN